MRQVFLALAIAIAAVPAVRAAPPLVTEDSGTLGDAKWQFELTVEAAREDRNGASYDGTEASIAVTRGFGKSVDLQLVLPYQHVTEVSGGSRVVAEGMRDASLNLKWRFYEHESFSLALMPSLYLPTGADGLSTERFNAGAILIGSYEAGAFEAHANLGARSVRNVLGLRDHMSQLSAAVMYTVHERLKLIADQSSETTLDPSSSSTVRYTTLGAIWIVAPGAGLGCGVKLGHGEPAIDRTVLCGIGFRP